MTLAAWSLGLVACALLQDPLDAWSLELDLGAELLPVPGDAMKLQQERGPLGHATVTNF